MFRFTKNHPKQTISEQFVGICMGILLIFALFIGLFLAFYSVRYSYYTPSSCVGPVQLTKDNSVINILFFLATVLLLPILNIFFQKLGEYQRKAGYIFLVLCCLIYVIMCLIWVSELPYYPSGDQLIVTAAAHYHLDGNFTMLANGGYLGQYPFQKGLTILYELLFTIFGDFCYSVAAKFHIGMGVITLITGYLFVEETSHNNICKIIYCLLFLFCAPYIILTPYIYGDLPSICLCTVLFWALLRFARTENKLYIILCCVTASLSLMVRTHTWIVLIAVFIGMFLVSLQKKLLAPILAAALIITSSFATQNAVNYSYLLRSGFPSTYGAPMVLWIAMGTQNNENGPGTYNNYQNTVLSEADFNRDVAAEIGKNNLQENLQHFAEDTDYATWFFKTKLQMQWIEPTFETLLSTYSFDEDIPLPNWISEIYFGSLHDPLNKFSDRYQSIVYLGFLFFLPMFWKKHRENAAVYIPLIAIVGGFLFSIIWEAQCRYVLPYYMFMLLYVPDGIWCVSQWAKLVCNLIRKQICSSKKKTDTKHIGQLDR